MSEAGAVQDPGAGGGDPATSGRDRGEPRTPAGAPELPEGVLAVRMGPGANCSSAGSAIDVLFYGSVLVGAIAVALAAAFPPREPEDDGASGTGGAEAKPVESDQR